MAWPLIKYLPEKTRFTFVRFAPVLGTLSALACVAALYLTLFPFQPPCGGLNCGVDFRGGTVMEIATPGRPVDLGVVRETLGALGAGDVQVQSFGDPTSAMVRFESPAGENPTAAVDRVKAVLDARLGAVELRRADVVGPKVSGELLGKGVIALLAAIALMLVYIWMRFGLTFGLGAVLALTHDVVLTFGLFALTRMEFTLTAIGAILTIIGYSINDKVVVLDRIRENLRKFKKMPIGDLIDLSINETLSRTIITGVTGIMALGVMAVFGGEALFAFAVAMIFGIVVGTYSSIYVAAPAMALLLQRTRRAAEAKPQPEGEGKAITTG